MPLTITGDLITSDRTKCIAWLVPGRPHAWQVTWLPGQDPGPQLRRHRDHAARRDRERPARRVPDLAAYR